MTNPKIKTPAEAASIIRRWAKLNFTPKSMTYHQFMDLANELSPEGEQPAPAVSGESEKEVSK